jgi:hypothetical protein
MSYFANFLNELAAPAIAVAVLGAVGKWYLDRTTERQTTTLEGQLAQETERLKHSLASRLAVTQAKLQWLQQVSASVHKSRRACRDLNEIVFPQTEAEGLRLTKLAQTDYNAVAALVQDRSAKLGRAFIDLEEALEGSKEYLLLEHISQLEQLITAYHDLRSKIAEFFAPTAKSPTFATETAELFTRADVLGRATAENLVATRKRLLDAHAA